MSDNTPYRRGDVVLAELPFADVAGAKVRPVVVVQNDIGNRFSPNLIVVMSTSQVPSRALPVQLVVIAGSYACRSAGLDKATLIDCGVIHTLAKSHIIRKIGVLPAETLAQLDRRLKISLALA